MKSYKIIDISMKFEIAYVFNLLIVLLYPRIIVCKYNSKDINMEKPDV